MFLDKGMNYRELKKSFVIFICTFDYFDKDRYMYTFKNQCQEDSSLYLDDETTAIVLNVNGTLGDINDELKGVLKYMAGQTPAGGYAGILDKAVKEVKVNEKWRRDYMTMALKLQERDETAKLEKTVSVIRNGKGKGSDDFLIGVLDLNKEKFNTISRMIDEDPDKTDWEIATAILYG